jgi:trimeric autotransporter adhesin
MRFAGVLALSLLVLSPLLAPTAAQTVHAALRGSVRDATGTVAAAVIRLTERRTGVVRATVSNGDGEYLLADLGPGDYDIEVSAPGYKAARHQAVTLAPLAAVTLDIALEPGEVTERVTVRGAVVDHENGVLSTAFSGAALVAQPTAGRNIFIMAALAPTVLPTGNAVFVRQQDQSNASLISMAGSARRANAYVLDGVPIADIQNRATLIPGMEAVEEVRVQLAPYDAGVGRTSGGVFNVTARAGANAWTGSGVYQNRPHATQAQLFFAAKAGLPRVDTSYHLVAGSAGGPLVRNRAFFFLSGEGYRTESSRTTVLNLPTAEERRGDFSGRDITLYDPLTTRPDPAAPGRFARDPFPGNRIPADRLNPVAMAMLGHLPAATGAVPVSTGVLDEARQITAKLTQQWTPRQSTSVLYAWYRSAEPDARFFGGGLFENGADPGDGALVRRVHFVALNHAWTIRDHSLLQARYGLNQFLDDNRGADFDPATLGFDPRFIASVPFRKFPSVSVSDYGQGGALLGDRDRQRGVFYGHTVSGSLTTLKGRHTLQAGAEYRITGVDFRNLGGSGYFSFTRDFTSGPDPIGPAAATGNALASFLLGYPASGGIYTSSPIDAYVRYGAGYLQDEVRLHRRLTLQVGVRYEFEDGLREAENRMAVGWAGDAPFPIQVGGLRPDGTPLVLRGGLRYAGIDGAPTVQGAADRWHLSPRLLAAFSVNDRTLVRGGYGVFRAPQQGISASEIGTGTRGYNVTTNLVTTLENRFIPCATCTFTYPFPGGVAQPTGHALGVMTGVGGGVEFVDPASTPGHYHRYSIEIERQVGDRLTMTAAYAGAVGRNLAVGGSSGSFIDVNQLDPAYLALGAGLVQPVTNPFFGTPLAPGHPGRAGHSRGTTAAALPAVQCGLCPSVRAGTLAVRRAHARRRSPVRSLGAGCQLHVQPPSGQPVR